MASERKKKAIEGACLAACRSYAGLELSEAYVSDDVTHVDLIFADEYYTKAETSFDFYAETEASASEIAEHFAEAAKSVKLAEGEARYIDGREDEDGNEMPVSEEDLETLSYQLQDALDAFAAAFAANALEDEGGGFLVVAGGVRWDGASGYKLADSAADATARDYDATLRFKRMDEGTRVAELVESSHDAPMGALVTVIALTCEEREKLEEMGFDEVMAWAREKAGE